jgi:hypothetical protein
VDHAPDEETLIILRELRKLFPLWTITYSLQMGAWIARSQKKTICENAAALLCIALTLIERRQRQHAHGPGRHWPPPGTAPGGHANGTLAPSWFMPAPIQITCRQCGHTVVCDASSEVARDQTCGECACP